jgi:hypothetical protein
MIVFNKIVLYLQKNKMNEWLKLILFFYCSGFLAALFVGSEGISRNITFKRIRATIVMALFSWFVLFYLMGGGDSKNYKDF